MWRLAGIVLALASAAGATPVAFTGTSSVGGDYHNLFLRGISNGFEFLNASEHWSTLFKICNEGEPCDLSYAYYVQQSLADFIASDGLTRTGSNGVAGANGGPPGMAEGLVTWTATPLTSLPVMIPGPGGTPAATVVLPITVFGHLRAWTPDELAAHRAPFFDYEITATGTLTALFYGTSDYVRMVDAEFTGYAIPVPEPGTWFPMLGLGFVWLWRNRKRGARPSRCQ